MLHRRFLFVAALLFLTTATDVFSFDIAIYYDPVSSKNDQLEFHNRSGIWPPCVSDSSSLFSGCQSLMEETYGWYRDMGVTKVMVNYPYASNYALIPQDCTHIQVMNWFFPGPTGFKGGKYVESQRRDVQVGLRHDLNEDEPSADWSFESSIGSGAQRIQEGGPSYFAANNRRPVVAMSGSTGTLWKPQSELGAWLGWDYYNMGWIDNTVHMPMHCRLTWAVDPVGNIDTSTALADFYWIVRIPNWRLEYYPDGARWWRFPTKTLKLNGQDGVVDTIDWIESNFYEDAQSGSYTLLTEDFDSLDAVSYDDIYYGSQLDEDAPWWDVAFGRSEGVRMMVNYRGTHAFYLNRIEVYDEGSWRMFASSDSTTYDSLTAIYFQNEMSAAGGKLAGWYYDEWFSYPTHIDPQVKSIVKINKILQSASPALPTFFMNGHGGYFTANHIPDSSQGRNDLFAELDDQNVDMPVQMMEFYFLTDGTNEPSIDGESPIESIYTVTTSDTPYVNVQQGDAYVYWEDGYTYHRYTGYKSLQAAIDGYIWGIGELTNVAGAGVLADTPPMNRWWLFTRQALEYQVRFAHQHVHNGQSNKLWALVSGGDDNGLVRTPTPNEAKLQAWLAVACDVDGIMWYPYNFGGLLAWTDTCHTDLEPTERYEAVAEACTQIKRLTPILESLEFVKTYASRAFERWYPNNGYEATQLDTLATNCSWHGQNYRAVAAINAYAPDTSRAGDWSSSAELHPYVQVSRFRNRSYALHDPAREDFWFLIVNRRALENERRKIRLALEIDTTYQDSVYYVDHILSRGVNVAEMDSSRLDNQAMRYIDVVLDPGEAELVHFFRGAPNCDTTLAHVQQLTVAPTGNNTVKLDWAEVTETDSGDAFHAEYYSILGSSEVNGDYAPIDTSTTTTYLDSINIFQYPQYFYQVKVCGWITN